MIATLPPPATLTELLSVVDTALAGFDRRLPAHVSREDLASAGKQALLEAMHEGDVTADSQRAYCYARVRGAMLDELRRQDPLSRHGRDKVNKLRRAAAALERTLGRVPSRAELSALTGFSFSAIDEIERLATAADLASLDETDAFGDAHHHVADPAAPCPARAAEAGDTARSLDAALARLPANHAHVARRYFLEDATLEEIGAELGVSKERVRQLREAAASRLRADFTVLSHWQAFLHHNPQP